MVVSVVEDNNGFVMSNNSTIGEHVSSNDTVYVHLEDSKSGKHMNLSTDITDIFMTLRYVSNSVIDKA